MPYVSKKERRDAHALRSVLSRPQYERFLIQRTLNLVHTTLRPLEQRRHMEQFIRDLYAAHRT